MAAVTLDLWHTLIYLPPEAEEAYMAHQLSIGRDVLAHAAPLPGAPELSEAELGKAFERAYMDAVQESSHGRSVTPAEQLSRAAHETGRVPQPEVYLRRLKEEIAQTSFRRAPGALELLSELRGRGYRVGVISNTVGEPGAYLRPVLTTMGFDPLVQAYVFSDEQPWTKPDPAIFRYALSCLHEDAQHAVHVGDGWSDLEGARRAGYRGAVLFTGLHEYGDSYRKLFLPDVPGEPPARFQAERLADVGPLVAKLLSEP